MAKLVGVTNLSVTADREPDDILVGLSPGNYDLQVAMSKPDGLGNFLAGALKVDQPTRIYFAVSDEHGVSNEISKTLTLRMAPVEPPVEPPKPIVLAGITLDLEVMDDGDDENVYTIEVTA